jgi:hypothetical protein
MLCLSWLFSSDAKEGNDLALVGKWEVIEGEGTMENMESIELLKDGTGILAERAFGSVMKLGITWKTERVRLYVTETALGFEVTGVSNYKKSGSTLTLTEEDGDRVRLKKVR